MSRRRGRSASLPDSSGSRSRLSAAIHENLGTGALFGQNWIVAGGALGVLFATWGVVAVRAMLPPEQARLNPGWTRIDVDPTVLAFSAGISIVTAFVVGTVPALVASGADPQHALNEDARGTSPGRGRHRLRGVLVTAEIALALTMLAGTIVTVRSFASPG